MKQRGFTLIELLVVIAMVGILATVIRLAVDPDPLSSFRSSNTVESFTESKRCLDGVLYHDINGNLTPAYNTDGTIKSC